MNEIDARLHEMDNLIAHKGYTRKVLSDAFDRVAVPGDWKAPINAIIPAEDQDVVQAAIEFFTATSARFVQLSGTTVQVIATGYRMGPAGP